MQTCSGDFENFKTHLFSSLNPDLHNATMSKRLVLSNSNDDVDNLKMKMRFTIAESDDDDDDDDPCYDVEEFNNTRRNLHL